MLPARPTAAGAAAGIAVVGAESLRPSLTPRSTLHQGLVTALMASTGAAVGAAAGAAVGRLFRPVAPDSVVAAGTLVGASLVAVALGRRHVVAQGASHAEWAPRGGRPAVGAGAGIVAAAGLAVTGSAAGRQVRRGSVGASQRFGGHPALWAVGGVALIATAAVAGARSGFRSALGSLAADSRAADEALAEPIDDPHVSGGPGSAVDYETLSREGRRYVHWRVSAADMREAGITDPREPVRVFVGLDSAESISGRVDLAMAELERLGAFDRAHIVAACPAGSGYANSVPTEALELYSHGDCASVVVQYGLLPSMLSIPEIPAAAEGFRLLIDRISGRIASASPQDRPKLHLYGESLGAAVAQTALTAEPSLVDRKTARIAGIDTVLFVGTPGGTGLRDELRQHPGVVHVDRWQDLPEEPPADCQFWLLDHDADPVTRFEIPLVARRPGWLGGETRGRNIPDQMRWIPLTTWQQVMLDVAYATQAQSGVFRSLGHDYRADLAPMVAAAWEPRSQGEIQQVQTLLADREVTRDRMLDLAEAGK